MHLCIKISFTALPCTAYNAATRSMLCACLCINTTKVKIQLEHVLFGKTLLSWIDRPISQVASNRESRGSVDSNSVTGVLFISHAQ